MKALACGGKHKPRAKILEIYSKTLIYFISIYIYAIVS